VMNASESPTSCTEKTLVMDRFQHAPINELLNWQVLPGAEGEATLIWEVDHRHHNPMGKVHGGAISAICDAAMGIAFGRAIDENQDFSTIEMKVNFMRPVTAGTLTVAARVIQRGLRIGFVECQVHDQRRRLIATAQCSCTTI
jgi:uncharacterized protein (TIGR00369 family)